MGELFNTRDPKQLFASVIFVLTVVLFLSAKWSSETSYIQETIAVGWRHYMKM